MNKFTKQHFPKATSKPDDPGITPVYLFIFVSNQKLSSK